MAIEQWGRTDKDPGGGGVNFYYPVQFTPFVAIASCTDFVIDPSDASVISMQKTYCIIDVKQGGYRSDYLVIIIGN